jgi:Reverse gyrase
LRDFNPFKTNILITATSDEFANDENIAKLRTMKAMRSALTGIPIVDMSWCQACLKAQDIVLEANNLVTSLPTKIESYMEKSKISKFIDRPRDFSTASYGVLALASCHHSARSQSLLLFRNIKVFLAGDGWNKETTKSKDVQLLVKEGGGSLIPSALDAIKAIGKLAKELIVILCDDSDVDSSSGISSNLAGAIRESYHSRDFAREKPILVVDSKWLFDSISCAKLLEATYFKPSSPIATSMWHLCN